MNPDYIKKLLTRKLEALMIHSNFKDNMRLAGFDNLYEIQDTQYKEEHQRFQEFNNWIIDNYDVIIDPTPTEHHKFYLTHKGKDKRYLVKEMIENWLLWEVGTRQLIEGIFADLNPTDKQFVVPDLMGVAAEIKEITDLKKRFEAVEYDMTYVLMI